MKDKVKLKPNNLGQNFIETDRKIKSHWNELKNKLPLKSNERQSLKKTKLKMKVNEYQMKDKHLKKKRKIRWKKIFIEN